MSEDNKPTPQDTINAIAWAKNMEDLQKALQQIDSHNAEEKEILINSLEKYTLDELINTRTETPSKEDWEMTERLMDLASSLFGNDFIDSMAGDDCFEIHRLLVMADKVATKKKDKTDPILKDLLAETAKLSDRDYNSMMALSRTLVKVAKKHSSVGDNDNTPSKPSNPFRGRYGSPRK